MRPVRFQAIGPPVRVAGWRLHRHKSRSGWCAGSGKIVDDEPSRGTAADSV